MAKYFRGRCLRVALLVGLAMAVPVPAAQAEGKKDLYGDLLPEGAVARMGSMRFRHFYWTIMGFTPDGKSLLASNGTFVHLWDPVSGKRVREIAVDSGFTVDVSPDGKLLATSGTRGVHLLDPSAGRLLRTIPRDHEVLAFSPNSELLATASKKNKNGEISLWDPATAKLVSLLSDKDSKSQQRHEIEDEVGRFTTDGKTFVAASERDMIIRHWDVKTGELTARVATAWSSSENMRIWMSPDARSLLVVSENGDASLCDTKTGKERYRLDFKPGKRGGALSFNHDGQTLVSYVADRAKGESVVTLRDAQTGKVRRQFTIATVAWDVTLSPDDRTLLVHHLGAFSLWDVATGKRLAGYAGHDGEIWSLAFSHDGRRLVSSGSTDGTLRVWEAATGKQERILVRSRSGQNTFAISPDDRSVLSAGDNDLVLHELGTGKELKRFQPGGDFSPDLLVMTPDGRSAVSRCFSWTSSHDYRSNLLVWDLASGKVTTKREESSESELGMTRAISPDRQWTVSVSKKGPSVIQEIRGERILFKLPLPDTNNCPPAISPDGRLMVSLSYTESPDEKLRSRKSTLYGWDLATGKECFRIPIPGEWIDSFQLVISPDGRTIAATRENTLQVWDAVSGEELLRRTDTESRPFNLAFAPDGKRVATGNVDGSILVWDISEQLAKRAAPPTADDKSVEQWWTALNGEDAGAAYAAIYSLAASPSRALPLLREKLKPVSAPTAERIRRLIADLDDEDFTRRTAAARELEALDELAEPALRKAVKETASPEQRRQLQVLLDGLPTFLASRNALRPLRALQVLELMGTREARDLVETLAKGAPAARLTREVNAILERLHRRD